MHNRRDFLKYSALLASASIAHPLLSPQNSLVASSQKSLMPAALKKGDKVIIVSPAGAVYDSKKIMEFKKVLSDFGFEVEIAKSAANCYGFLAGTDEERAADINAAFANQSIKGIFCSRGGWGCARIFRLLDFKLIADNPKMIMGFSDITSLILAIYTKTNLITFHGPLGLSSWDPFSTLSFTKTVLLGEKSAFPLDAENKMIMLSPGIARGELIGGNLSVFNSLIGTEYIPNCDGKILFLEDLNEDTYTIDRMLTQLKLAGILDKLSGFIFGQCTDCKSENPKRSFSLLEVLKHHVLPLKIPAIFNAPFGHTTKKWTIPIGAMAELNAQNLSLELLQPAVVI